MAEHSEPMDAQRVSSDVSGSPHKVNKRASAAASGKAPQRRKRKRLSAWQRSIAGQTARLEFAITLTISAGLSIAAYSVFIDSLSSSKPPKVEVPTAIFLFVLGFVGLLVGFFRHTQARIHFQEAAEAKSRQAVDSAVANLRTDHSFSALYRVNQTQMDQYHGITKHQAANSYRNSQIAMGSGLAFVVLAAIAAIVLKDEQTKIILGSIAGVATAFSAYIGATFLNAYHSALNQLNTYFHQPMVTSYLLSAERIASSLSPENRDEMRAKIINTMLQGAIDERRHQSEAKLSPPAAFRRNKNVIGTVSEGSANVSGTR